MKPHPRIRKTIKWGGAVVTVLLVVVWIGSGWWSAAAATDAGHSVTLTQGTWLVGKITSANPSAHGGFLLERWSPPLGPRSAYFRWWFNWTSWKQNWCLGIPGWIPTAFALLATAIAWRLDTIARRRERLYLCPKCNYDRTGITSDMKCPECGSGGTQA